MYHSSSAIPGAADITVSMFDHEPVRVRVLRMGSTSEGVMIHIESRDVLDAFQAALDAIRADFDASEGITEQAERPRGPLAAEAVPA